MHCGKSSPDFDVNNRIWSSCWNEFHVVSITDNKELHIYPVSLKYTFVLFENLFLLVHFSQEGSSSHTTPRGTNVQTQKTKNKNTDALHLQWSL